MAVEEKPTATVRISNIPKTAVAKDLFDFFESTIGEGSVFACEIFTERKNWKSKGFGRVQFETLAAKSTSLALSEEGKLLFKGSYLYISAAFDDVIFRPVEPQNRVESRVLYTGFLSKRDCMCVLESWKGVKTWVSPERRTIEFWVVLGGDLFRLEVQFSDILEACSCCLDDNDDDEPNAVLLKLKYAPKIFEKISGPNITSKFSADRYHICKEDFDFFWVRTTDFSGMKSIGQSSALCLEIGDGLSSLDIFTNLPYYNKDLIDLTMEESNEFSSPSSLVPLINLPPDSNLAYEILFQLNSLVHTHKISLASINNDLIDMLSGSDLDTTMMILQKMHKLNSTCYDPVSFVKTRLHFHWEKCKKLPSPSCEKSRNYNVMHVHRALVTPSKIYCLGPELESSNYVVKNFAPYASDFMRVTFVEEDWGKLSATAISASIERGFFSKPYRTNIHRRILSVLRDGIVIGSKHFEFLSFSASQLRSNSVWMFASNEKISAEDIRKWMGCFDKIRSVSKCAARMGQLFSSSTQTMEVSPLEVEVIPDIETTSDGVGYCFSDGIGKISASFAKTVAEKCRLDHVPSAFQVRYGGYKGVIAVDRNSFRKLSLRGSMLKFESKNRMLNVTSWSQSLSCYLNREIITLLSTLGVKDEAFESLQRDQLEILDKMRTCREQAISILENMGGGEIKGILVKMLLQGYEPNVEPYLSMMLESHRENLLSDIRTRCRILVPKGRILMGCLDETGILEYGQVYVRMTMTKAEIRCGEQSFFQKVDEKTCVVIGKVVVTKNPCLHPGDIRVLDAVYEVGLEEKGLVDCLVFPQRGERPHPNECSGGDLDGDLYFISWDENLRPPQTVTPMDYTGRRPRLMDHDVSLEEIQKFFVEYMINDTLGTISTAHLINADREPEKALSPKCLQLANLHSMAVDFAKTGAPAEMPRVLKPREFPDFMERWDRPSYVSQGVLGKLHRVTINSSANKKSNHVWSEETLKWAYDRDMEVEGYESCIEIAKNHKEMYWERMSYLMSYYEAEREDEILTGNLRNKSAYLQRDNRRYGELKDRILVSVKSLHREARGWFEGGCGPAVEERWKVASAWYCVTYHPDYCSGSVGCLGFPWVLGDILLEIKTVNSRKRKERD